jgi:hypothetical protein
MDILTRPFVEAELKISTVKLIFGCIAPLRQNPISALIGKLEPDDLTASVLPVPPSGVRLWCG